MSDSLKNLLRSFLMLLVFAAGVGLVIIGQQEIGAPGLGLMLLGLTLLIVLLWIYNRKYK